MSIKKLGKSLKYALRGLLIVVKSEQSFKIQLFAGACVIVSMLLLDLAVWERILLLLLVSAVLVLEVINTIFEKISDAMKPRLDLVVREIKDMMAGAVLITSVTSLIVAVMIFWKYIVNL